MTDPATYIAQDGAPYLAVDVVPDVVDGTFVLDVSELDGLDLLGWPGSEDAWTNVVCDVFSVHITRGATRLQGALTRAEAGACIINLTDTMRRFDPMVNADAIHANTPLRVRAWGFDLDGEPWEQVLFTGTIDAIPVTYPKGEDPQVTITASDVIATLAAWGSVGRAEPGVGAGDTLLGRVQREVAETGMPAGTVSADSDSTYAATLNPAPLAAPWDEIAAATDAELGRVWASSSNQLVVRARESELSGPVRGTLSDLHGEAITGPHCCYSSLDAALGTETLSNRTIGSRAVLGGDPASVPVQRDDTFSQARHGVHVNRQVLELETEAQLVPWTESLLITDSTPELRVDSVTPAPWTDLDTALQAWPAVCATDIGDRWLIRYRPGKGPDLERTSGVLGIEHTITPDGWAVVWLLVDAPTPGVNPSGWFALDVSDLDTGDLLAPFGGAVPALPG